MSSPKYKDLQSKANSLLTKTNSVKSRLRSFNRQQSQIKINLLKSKQHLEMIQSS